MRRAASSSVVVILVLGALSSVWVMRPVRAGSVVVPDDYATIQEAVDAANAGDTVFVRGGVYDERLTVNKTLVLRGEGMGTTTIRGDGVRNVVEIAADGVALTGFTIDGVKVGSTNDGIKLFRVKDCRLSNNNLVNNYFGVMLFSSLRTVIANSSFDGNAYGIGADVCSGTVIRGNRVTKGYLGIGPDQCSNTTIAENNITDTQFGIGIDFLLNNNTIAGNVIESNGFGIWLNFLSDTSIRGNRIIGNIIMNNGNGIWLDSSANSEIVGNDIVGNSYGIELYTYSTNNTITGNDVAGNSLCGIKLASSSNNRIEGNDVSGNPCGILLQGSLSDTVSANNITGSDGYGLRLVSSTGATVSHNRFVGDGLFVFESYGSSVEDNLVNGKPLVYLEDESDCVVDDAGQVVLVNCSGVQVSGLDLSDTTVGVELWQTSHATVSRNRISNDNYGIVLRSSSGNWIDGNEVAGNNYGIRLFSSTGNNLTENTISGNGEGIFIDSADNRIYHNAFIDNAAQANVGSLPNAWDGGYPNGGNYWSDYDGKDVYRGSRQDTVGGDGLGDTPYGVGEDNVDRFPLMKRWLAETVRGDVSHDGTVNIFDIVAATSIYGCMEDSPEWNPEADLAAPYGIISIQDMVTISAYYGRKASQLPSTREST